MSAKTLKSCAFSWEHISVWRGTEGRAAEGEHGREGLKEGCSRRQAYGTEPWAAPGGAVTGPAVKALQ